MKVRKYWILMATLGICLVVGFSVKLLAISPNEKDQLKEFGISTLKGLEGVHPVVFLINLDSVGKSENRYKLGSLNIANWQYELETQVELTLRKNGINKLNNATSPTLLVCIEANAMQLPIVNGSAPYIYAIQVSTGVYEVMRLYRNPEILTRSQTWPPDPTVIVGRGLTIAGKDKVQQGIRESVIRQVDEFCNDYLAANPKEQPKDEQKQ